MNASATQASWGRRIRRAHQLASEDGPAAPLLAFYARLLRAQQEIYDAVDRGSSSGALLEDLPIIRRPASALLRQVAKDGPEQLAQEARALLSGSESELDGRLMTYWHEPSDRQFFAKAILQPYGQRLSEAGATGTPIGTRCIILARRLTPAANRCPVCGGMPQLSVLEASPGADEGSGRRLVCATCLSSWPFRRLLCPSCGEEDERRLGYFESPMLEHVRVDVCESCHRYIKTVNLARLGLAVPLVDEVAGAPLDVWAREHQYEKVELNLVGL